MTSLGTGRMAVAELGWHVGGVGVASAVYMPELRTGESDTSSSCRAADCWPRHLRTWSPGVTRSRYTANTSSINVCATSEADSDGSELDVEITQVSPSPNCSSSKTSPLPARSAATAAVDVSDKDPLSQPKEPLPRGPHQQSTLSFLPKTTIAPRRPTAATAKRKGKRQQEIEAAATKPTAPARAAHIDKPKLVGLNKDRRKAKANDGGSKEEEEEKEGEEEKEAMEVVGTKRKPKKTVGRMKALRARVSTWERVKQFPNHTLDAVKGGVYCQACNKGLNKDKKSIVGNHCKGDLHLKAVVHFARKKHAKQTSLDMFGDHDAAQLRKTLRLFEAARLLNFAYAKQHQLGPTDVDILEKVFPFVTPAGLHELVIEKD